MSEESSELLNNVFEKVDVMISSTRNAAALMDMSKKMRGRTLEFVLWIRLSFGLIHALHLNEIQIFSLTHLLPYAISHKTNHSEVVVKRKKAMPTNIYQT